MLYVYTIAEAIDLECANVFRDDLLVFGNVCGVHFGNVQLMPAQLWPCQCDLTEMCITNRYAHRVFLSGPKQPVQKAESSPLFLQTP